MQNDKHSIRRRLRRARRALGRRERERATLQANRRLKAFIKRGKRIAVYWPVGSELRLDNFVESARQRGAQVYLPYIEKRRLRLWFTPYRSDGFSGRARAGRWDIPQFEGRKIRAERLDVMVLPLVGIDDSGFRLGQGGGFYDASLARARFGKPLAIGAGFACQKVGRLPREAHDKQLDGFVCERAAYRFSSRSKK